MTPSPIVSTYPYATKSHIRPHFQKAALATGSNPIIAPRHFNDLTFTSAEVTKSSLAPSIRGELHFYRNVPHGLEHLFPSFLSSTIDPVTITITRVHGLTLSTLLTTCEMHPSHVEMTLKDLHAMHTYGPFAHVPLVYANHGRKVESRFRVHENTIYHRVGLSFGNHFDSLLHRLRHYESGRRGFPAAVIHGDPVLTNIIRETASNSLKFIDMRGAQGAMLTVAGDAVYDLAKVLQSLLGYDFILSDVPIDLAVIELLTSLLRVYWKQVATLYPDVAAKDVVTVCCALYTSLIPLHENDTHRRKFAIMAEVLLTALDNEDLDDAGSWLVRRAMYRLSFVPSHCA